KGPANQFVLNWRSRQHQGTVSELLIDLQQEFVPKVGKERLYKKFKSIRQEEGGRLKPIIEVMEQLRNLQMLLPHVTDSELYYTFKDAMEPELCTRVETEIDEETTWEEIKTIAQKHDEALYKLRQRKRASRDKPHQQPWRNERRPPQQPRITETKRTETRYEHREKPPSMQKPYQSTYKNSRPQGSRLTDKEKEDCKKKNECFKCGKPGHLARDCRQNATQVSSHSTTLKEGEEESGTDEKIATQSTRLTEKSRPNSLIAAVEINGHPAQALIDQLTIGANLISNKLCAVHNL